MNKGLARKCLMHFYWLLIFGAYSSITIGLPYSMRIALQSEGHVWWLYGVGTFFGIPALFALLLLITKFHRWAFDTQSEGQ